VPQYLDEIESLVQQTRDALAAIRSDGGAHLGNYNAAALTNADTAITNALTTAHASPVPTQQEVTAVYNALQSAKAALRQNHSIVSVDTGTPDSHGNTKTGQGVKVTIKGVFADISAVTLDGRALTVVVSRSITGSSAELYSGGTYVGTMTETSGGVRIEIDKSIADTWDTSTHTLGVTFTDAYSTSTAVATIDIYHVPWAPYDGSNDGDGDGYTDAEEWAAGTNEFDPNDHPNYKKTGAATGGTRGAGASDSNSGLAANGADADANSTDGISGEATYGHDAEENVLGTGTGAEHGTKDALALLIAAATILAGIALIIRHIIGRRRWAVRKRLAEEEEDAEENVG